MKGKTLFIALFCCFSTAFATGGHLPGAASKTLLHPHYDFFLKDTVPSNTSHTTNNTSASSPATSPNGVGPNNPPTAYAGADTNIVVPPDSVLLKGVATDLDGQVTSVAWVQVSGPAQSVLSQPAQAQTFAKNLIPGVYRFEFTATDNKKATKKDTVQVTAVLGQNFKPVVQAGADKNFSLPQKSVTLTGSATDVDGRIAAYKWRKLSGPAAFRIARPDSAQTLIDSLEVGYYEFELKATDNLGAWATDTVRVNVGAAKTANCNGVKKILLPNPDGGRFQIGDPAAGGWYFPLNPGDTAVLSAQSKWTYFSLERYSGTAACPIVIMNDSTGETTMKFGISLNSCQYMKVTGSGHGNTFYGINITNSDPDNNGVAVAIQGKSKNIEVERVNVYRKTYGVWAKQDPQCDTTFNYPNYVMDSIEIHHSTFKNIGQDCIYAGNTDPLGVRGYTCNGNVYNFIPMRLSNINIHHLVIDSCNRTGIQLGGAERGYNQIHDNVVSNCGFEYNQQQGTGISIGGMTRNCHVFNNKIKNTYLYGILSFGVGTNFIENNEIDSSGYLNGIPNEQTPTSILASPKQTIPFDSTRIIIRNNRIGKNAITTDDNHIMLVTWGPATWATNNVVCGNTRLNGTTPVATAIDPAIHYISNCSTPLPNFKPTAFTGPNVKQFLPADSTLLTGFGVDPDGTIVSYAWSQVSGPSTALLVMPGQAVTMVRKLQEGTYVFRVTVTDNMGATAFSEMVVVLEPNLPPTASAGADQKINLPATSVTLTGSGTDEDGSIVSYQWAKISGPASAVIVSPTTEQTDVSNLVQGIYHFELKVTDNKGAVARDSVKVFVYPEGQSNFSPVVNAGADQSLNLPANTVTLSGAATDADGVITTTLWTKVSGPSSGTISSPTQLQTTVTGLVQGTYLFELAVTDDQGATIKDTVAITVLAQGNLPPVVRAGADQTIALPKKSTQLVGTATDADGTIASTLWTKISGPAGSKISTPTVLTTDVTSLSAGTFLFELSATDNKGGTAKDTVMITVNPVSSATVVTSPEPGTNGTVALSSQTEGQPASGMLLYPNPAGSFIHIKLKGVVANASGLITISDAIGRVVYSEQFVQGQLLLTKAVNVSKLKRGVYIVNMYTNTYERVSMPFVKM